ncbi:TetR/AcrR family transcriptional regulator [soil metagenome]
MGGATTRLPGSERKALIEAAAGKLFGEKGYEATTLDEIAAAAGVTKPILYRHFDSKTALYMALLERHRDDLPSFVSPEMAGSLQEALGPILESWFAYVGERGFAWKMLFRDSGGGPEIEAERADVHLRAQKVMAEIIDAGSGGAIPAEQLIPTAELVSMGMAGLALWSLEHPEVQRSDLVGATERMVRGLLLAAR